VLCALGQHEAAIAEYEHALSLDPDFEPARLNLADAQRARAA
jgi:Tfp pilus assembly protein PilF